MTRKHLLFLLQLLIIIIRILHSIQIAVNSFQIIVIAIQEENLIFLFLLLGSISRFNLGCPSIFPLIPCGWVVFIRLVVFVLRILKCGVGTQIQILVSSSLSWADFILVRFIFVVWASALISSNMLHSYHPQWFLIFSRAVTQLDPFEWGTLMETDCRRIQVFSFFIQNRIYLLGD